MSVALKTLTTDLDEKIMGTLKFHNLELFLSLNEKKTDPEKIREAIVNLKETINKVEETLIAKPEVRTPVVGETLKIVKDPEKGETEVDELRNEEEPLASPLSLKTKPFFTLKTKYQEEKIQVKHRRFNSETYFNAKNHLDLFNVGSFYYQEYLTGKKNFALYAENSNEDVHESLLGFASYFNYHEDLKVTLVTNNFQHSILSKHLKNVHHEVRYFKSEEYFYEVIVSEGIEILEYSALRHICKKLGRELFDGFLDEILGQTDVSFWNVPSLELVDREREFFFPLMRKMDSTSVVLTKGKSSATELKKIINYAAKYSLKISGVLFDKGIKE